MGKFKQQNLKFKNDEYVFFGDGDDASIGYDGADLTVDVPLKGVAPTADDHLTTKGSVDTTVATVSGDIITYTDSAYADATHYHGEIRETAASSGTNRIYMYSEGTMPTYYYMDFVQDYAGTKTVARICSGVFYLNNQDAGARYIANSIGATDGASLTLLSEEAITGHVATVSGDVVAQIPSLAGYATEAYVDTASGALDSKLTDHKSSADHDGRYYTETEVTTISGDLVTYIDEELAEVRASRGGATFYFVDEDSDDIAGYEILGTSPGGNPEDTDVITITSASGSVLLGQYVTVSGSPNTTLIPGGEWTFDIYAKVSSTGGTTTITSKVYKRNEAGVETEILSSTTNDINATSVALYTKTTTATGVELSATDRIVIKHYGQTTSVSAITLTYYYEGTTNYSRVTTPVVVSAISDHSQLANLDYASAGHTGFQPAGDYVTDTEMTTISGDIVAQMGSSSSISDGNASFSVNSAYTANLNFNGYYPVTYSGTTSGTIIHGASTVVKVPYVLVIPTSAPPAELLENGCIWIE